MLDQGYSSETKSTIITHTEYYGNNESTIRQIFYALYEQFNIKGNKN